MKKPSQRAGGYRIGFCTVFIHLKKAGGCSIIYPGTFQMSRKILLFLKLNFTRYQAKKNQTNIFHIFQFHISIINVLSQIYPFPETWYVNEKFIVKVECHISLEVYIDEL